MNNELLKIDLTRSYEGYFWMSDSAAPMVFMKDKKLGEYLEEYEQPIEQLVCQQNPFIAEGFLFDDSEMLSCSIKFVDGQYLVNNTKVNIASTPTPVKSYLAHRMPGVEKLKFIKQWVEEEDPFCEDMHVFRPAGVVFVGFQLSTKKQRP